MPAFAAWILVMGNDACDISECFETVSFSQHVTSLRTRRFSKPTFRTSPCPNTGRTWKNLVFRELSTCSDLFFCHLRASSLWLFLHLLQVGSLNFKLSLAIDALWHMTAMCKIFIIMLPKKGTQNHQNWKKRERKHQKMGWVLIGRTNPVSALPRHCCNPSLDFIAPSAPLPRLAIYEGQGICAGKARRSLAKLGCWGSLRGGTDMNPMKQPSLRIRVENILVPYHSPLLQTRFWGCLASAWTRCMWPWNVPFLEKKAEHKSPRIENLVKDTCKFTSNSWMVRNTGISGNW